MGVDAEMFVRTRQNYTGEQVRKMAHNLAEAFGHKRFMISRPGEWDFYPNGKHCLELVDEYEQDGPSEFPAEGEQLIQVNLYTRYYGRGYERGDWPFIYSVARWLEARIPDAKVWYGGDSSGVLAYPLDDATKDELWTLFCGVGHEPYTHFFGRQAKRPNCDFCGAPMVEYYWGRPTVGFSCHGCGHRLFTDDGGGTFYEPQKED